MLPHRTVLNWLLLASVCAGMNLALPLLANAAKEPPPESPPKSENAPVVLELKSRGPMVIQVPRSALAGRGEGVAPQGAAWLNGDTLRTIVAGAALSLALVFGGLWLAGRMKRSAASRGAAKAATFLLAMIAMSGAIGVAWADIPVGPPAKPAGDLEAQVVVTDRGEAVTIRLTREQARKFAELAARDGATRFAPEDGAAQDPDE